MTDGYESHPSWVCGLKLPVAGRIGSLGDVTPFVGVWIETPQSPSEGVPHHVTPFVGVWIET